MNNFWEKLEKPFFILAPMENVTDTVFRQIVTRCAKPDVFFTEFTSSSGINSAGREKTFHRLKFTSIEKPIVAQIWGVNPMDFFKTAGVIKELGFDGIDINMGCPDKRVVEHGAGSALINNHMLVKDIVDAVKNGAQGLPVSIKTRIGFDSIDIENWIGFLLTLDLDALTIHGRTRSELSKVLAHWDKIGEIVEMRNKLNIKTLIIGNGDIFDRKCGVEKITKYGLDGIMIGRGIFNNLWAFEKNQSIHTSNEYLKMLLEHIQLFNETWGKEKSFHILKKFYKVYVKGFDGAGELREQLMNANSTNEVCELIRENIK